VALFEGADWTAGSSHGDVNPRTVCRYQFLNASKGMLKGQMGVHYYVCVIQLRWTDQCMLLCIDTV